MADPTSIFDSLRDEFLNALQACQTHARPGPVHALRIAGRKLEAFLLAVRRRNPRASSLRRQVKQTLRKLKEVRRAAASVRDLDVQRRLLAELAQPGKDPPILPGNEPTQAESHKLDRRLERRRRPLAAALVKDIAALAPALLLCLKPLAKRMAHLHPVPLPAMAKEMAQRSAERLRRTQYERRNAGRHGLSGKTLHAYRKRTKAARYLAELEPGSASAQKMVAEIKSRLDAIGRWHDLALLAETAKSMLGASAVLTVSVQAAQRLALELAVRSMLAQAPRHAGGPFAHDPPRTGQERPETAPAARSHATKGRALDPKLSSSLRRAEPTSEPHPPAEDRSESTPPREGGGFAAISAGSRAASPRRRSTPQRGSSNSVRPTRRKVR